MSGGGKNFLPISAFSVLPFPDSSFEKYRNGFSLGRVVVNKMLFPTGPAFQGSTSSSEFHFPLAFDEEKAAAYAMS